MRRVRGWVMPDEEACSMLQPIEERIRSSQIAVRHRDVLIRLRALIEEDLACRLGDVPSATHSERIRHHLTGAAERAVDRGGAEP